MNVIFDHQVFYLQKYGGISRYFVELARHLNAISDCNARIIAPFHQNGYLTDPRNTQFVYSFPSFAGKLAKTRLYDVRLQVNDLMARHFARREFSLLHETYYVHRTRINCKKVITVHDMIPELFHRDTANGKQLIEHKRAAIMEADGIIVVSENTRDDLLALYPEAADKAVTIHHGLSRELENENATRFSNEKPFILFVGHRDGYKNFSLLLTAFSAKELNSQLELICFGGNAFSNAELADIRKYGLNGRVKHLEGPDSMLHSLYRSAKALVYISKYEGFGMPVLEAMQLECPVICCDSSSLPEVADDAALYIRPDDAGDLQKAIHFLMNDQNVVKDLIKKGRKRALQFSWEECALQTFTFYKQVLG
jgi:glycosyltransferase involved in cell wall biosynthesis